MKNFKDFLKSDRDEIQTGLDVCFSSVCESTLSGLLDKSQKNDFAILTAYRKSNSKEQNVSLNRELRGTLNAKKMGVYPLVGQWEECQDDSIPYDQCPPEKKRVVVERSYFVPRNPNISPDEFKDLIFELGKKYKQDGVILKLETPPLFGVYDPTAGKELVKFEKGITVGKLSSMYSKFVKKMNVPFVFEGVETPNGIVYALKKFHDMGFRW